MDDFSDMFDDTEKVINLTLYHKSFVTVPSKYWKPSIDIFETDNSIVVFVELAGMEKEQIHLQYLKGNLIISGVRKPMFPDCSAITHQMEIDTGDFMRKIRVNVDINQEDIEAEYREGILKIMLPKRRSE